MDLHVLCIIIYPHQAIGLKLQNNITFLQEVNVLPKEDALTVFLKWC